MNDNKKCVDIVTKIINSKKEGKRTLYLAKTIFDDGKRYFAEFATASSRQKAGEKSLNMALDKYGLTIEDVKDCISFLYNEI